MNEIIPSLTTAIGAGWTAKKLLGPTIDIVGDDLKRLYEQGRNQILVKAAAKISDSDKEGRTNLRVTRDVFWNGSFTDEAICAEYFGGVLASSRSDDGKDDSGIFYVDIIKSLSSPQLLAHYLLYRSLNKYLLSRPEKQGLNVGTTPDLSKLKLYLAIQTFIKQVEPSDLGAIMNALHSKTLVESVEYNSHKLQDGYFLPYIHFIPTSLGIQLFAIANNRLSEWRDFPKKDFGDFQEIDLSVSFAATLDDLLKNMNLT